MRLLWRTHFKYIMTRILYICRFGHLGFYHYHSHHRKNEHWILVQSQDKWLLRAFCTSHGWFRSWSLVFVFPQPDSFPARSLFNFNIFYLDVLAFLVLMFLFGFHRFSFFNGSERQRFVIGWNCSNIHCLLLLFCIVKKENTFIPTIKKNVLT